MIFLNILGCFFALESDVPFYGPESLGPIGKEALHSALTRSMEPDCPPKSLDMFYITLFLSYFECVACLA